MSLRRSLFLCFFSVVGIIGLGGLLWAQEQGRKTILDFKEQLGLTAEQEVKIAEIISRLEKKLGEIRERVTKLDSDIRRLLEEEADLREVEKRVNEVFSLRARAVMEELRAAREIDAVLTQEQKAKWKNIRRGGRP